MPDCPSLPKCPFFNDHMASRPATAEMMKSTYCHGDNRDCARWMIATALGKPAVPLDLFPSQVDRARALIQAH
jgi:hypothetical protein